ncbi:hypothetical protein GWK47_052320 [Chionoecetes opilio]|uniref:Uncharacterized protein n=1 Tax=Chionoecetes opilio TaxID=41210 RepID=A0A8J4Y6L4_CHIOP|nr:hypothetical protein GWK47_052320 [Chionoecetes opilio]
MVDLQDPIPHGPFIFSTVPGVAASGESSRGGGAHRVKDPDVKKGPLPSGQKTPEHRCPREPQGGIGPCTPGVPHLEAEGLAGGDVVATPLRAGVGPLTSCACTPNPLFARHGWLVVGGPHNTGVGESFQGQPPSEQGHRQIFVCEVEALCFLVVILPFGPPVPVRWDFLRCWRQDGQKGFQGGSCPCCCLVRTFLLSAITLCRFHLVVLSDDLSVRTW